MLQIVMLTNIFDLYLTNVQSNLTTAILAVTLNFSIFVEPDKNFSSLTGHQLTFGKWPFHHT